MSALSFKSIMITAALGLATVLAAAASANATSPASLPAVSQTDNALLVDVQYRPGDRRHHGHWHGHRGRACSVQAARMKASRMGIRNARIAHRGRIVEARGMRHGRPARIAFANVPGCPVLR